MSRFATNTGIAPAAHNQYQHRDRSRSIQPNSGTIAGESSSSGAEKHEIRNPAQIAECTTLIPGKMAVNPTQPDQVASWSLLQLSSAP
jgi:hypothetical protein